MQYKAVPGVAHTMKKVPKKGKGPEGKSEKAVQDEQLLLALRNYISAGQSSLNAFEYERSQEQKERLDSFKEGIYFSLYTIRYLGLSLYNMVGRFYLDSVGQIGGPYIHGLLLILGKFLFRSSGLHCIILKRDTKKYLYVSLHEGKESCKYQPKKK